MRQVGHKEAFFSQGSKQESWKMWFPAQGSFRQRRRSGLARSKQMAHSMPSIGGVREEPATADAAFAEELVAEEQPATADAAFREELIAEERRLEQPSSPRRLGPLELSPSGSSQNLLSTCENESASCSASQASTSPTPDNSASQIGEDTEPCEPRAPGKKKA